MIQNTYAMRPGTIFGYRGEAWKVIFNDTLNRRFQAKRIEPRTHGMIKTFSYPPTNEINIRWKPFSN